MKTTKRNGEQPHHLIKYAIVVIALLSLASCTSANVCRGYSKTSDAATSIYHGDTLEKGYTGQEMQ
jgi:hypothetical protein